MAAVFRMFVLNHNFYIMILPTPSPFGFKCWMDNLGKFRSNCSIVSGSCSCCKGGWRFGILPFFVGWHGVSKGQLKGQQSIHHRGDLSPGVQIKVVRHPGEMIRIEIDILGIFTGVLECSTEYPLNYMNFSRFFYLAYW